MIRRTSNSLQTQSQVVSKLKCAPKKDLFNILLSLHIDFDYNADEETLARIIENRFDGQSSQKRTKTILNFYSLCHIIFVFSLMCAFLLTIVMILIWIWPKKVKFCDSNIPINQTFDSTKLRCIKCPSFAECQNGTAICEKNYTLIQNHCIYNDGDRMFVLEMLNAAYSVLQKRAGSFHCKTSNIDWMSTDELENILLKDSKLPLATDFPRVFEKTLSHLVHDRSIIFKDVDDLQVYISLEFTRDIQCKIRMALYERLNILVIISISSLMLFISLYVIKGVKKRRQIAARYSSFLIEQMRKGNGTDQTKQQLISKLNQVSGNQGGKIWPMVEKKLSNSPFVKIFNNGYDSVFRYVI